MVHSRSPSWLIPAASHNGFSADVHHHGSFTTATRGGLTPAPACRCRRTYLHLHNSMVAVERSRFFSRARRPRESGRLRRSRFPTGRRARPKIGTGPRIRPGAFIENLTRGGDRAFGDTSRSGTGDQPPTHYIFRPYIFYTWYSHDRGASVRFWHMRQVLPSPEPAHRSHPFESESMPHLCFFEAGVIGLLQGITELFPVSSLGHSVLSRRSSAAAGRGTSACPPPNRPTWRSS